MTDLCQMVEMVGLLFFLSGWPPGHVPPLPPLRYATGLTSVRCSPSKTLMGGVQELVQDPTRALTYFNFRFELNLDFCIFISIFLTSIENSICPKCRYHLSAFTWWFIMLLVVWSLYSNNFSGGKHFEKAKARLQGQVATYVRIYYSPRITGLAAPVVIPIPIWR